MCCFLFLFFVFVVGLLFFVLFFVLFLYYVTITSNTVFIEYTHKGMGKV